MSAGPIIQSVSNHDVGQKTYSSKPSNTAMKSVSMESEPTHTSDQRALRKKGESPAKATTQSVSTHALDQGAKSSTKNHWTELSTSIENPAEIASSCRWLTQEIMGPATTKPVSIWGLVVPQWCENLYSAVALLCEYVKCRCPVTVGRDWMLEELDATVNKGPHVSALAPDTIN